MTPEEYLRSQGILFYGRQSNPDGSVSTLNTFSPSKSGEVITPAPSLSDDQAAISSQYGLGDLYKYAGGSFSQLTSWLSRSDVPEDRKSALIAKLNGLISSLPEHSGLDLFSESIIGTSNYQKAMQKLSGDIGLAISDSINGNYEEVLNSASSRVDRERQAGINPDLAGISGDVAGQATDTNEMASGYTGLSDPIDPSQFMSAAFQGVQLITGFVGQIQGWISNDISNASAEVLLDNQVRDNVRNTFASVIQDKDQLDMETFKFVRDYYGPRYPQLGADSIKTREDLDNFISGYNKQEGVKKIGIEDLFGSAILSAAKKHENPFHGLRAKRAYERSLRAIQPNSPYVQSYIRSLEAQASGATVENERNTIELKALLGPYGDAVRKSYEIIQEANNEYNKYTKTFYQKRNGFVPVQTADDGTTVDMQYTDLEFRAEAQAHYADRMNSLAVQFQKKISESLHETFATALTDLEKKYGKNDWRYIVASISFPGIITYLEKDALQQIGAVFSRPAPSPHNTQIINNRDSHNVSTFERTNNY